MTQRLDAFPGTDTGRNPDRPNNEDSCYSVYQDPHVTSYPLEAKGTLFIAADGVGGHAGGGDASLMAVQLVPQRFYNGSSSDLLSDLVEAIRETNRNIYHRQISDPNLYGMGTTITAAVILDNQLYVAHVGDSRAYLLRGNQLTLLTRDHSLVEEMVAKGLISDQEAANHPQKNVITRSLGAKLDVEVDARQLDFQKGDVLLLCSDGLSNVVPPQELQAFLAQHRPAEEISKHLIDRANGYGGPDNITAVVIRNGGPMGKVKALKPEPMHLPFGPIILSVGAVALITAILIAVIQLSRSTAQAPLPLTPSVPTQTKAATIAISTTTPTPIPQWSTAYPADGAVLAFGEPVSKLTWLMPKLNEGQHCIVKYDGKDSLPETCVQSQGATTYEFQLPEALVPGTHTWHIVIVDSQGTVVYDTAPTWTFTVETPPVPTPIPVPTATQTIEPTATSTPVPQCTPPATWNPLMNRCQGSGSVEPQPTVKHD